MNWGAMVLGRGTDYGFSIQHVIDNEPLPALNS